MTPYTSFLVLESDEDRERYGVTRRVRMRDGERFFAETRDRATLEMRRDLMKKAGRWRVGMRRSDAPGDRAARSRSADRNTAAAGGGAARGRYDVSGVAFGDTTVSMASEWPSAPNPSRSLRERGLSVATRRGRSMAAKKLGLLSGWGRGGSHARRRRRQRLCAAASKRPRISQWSG